MQFDWVFLNPIHYPGFSGSLYAVKDPYRLHDRFQGSASESPDDLIRGFCGRAEQHGMRVMLDLVVNHTAKDSVLAEQHPEWFRREADGSLYSPRAVDPVDPAKVTIWGDLAELDYENGKPALVWSITGGATCSITSAWASRASVATPPIRCPPPSGAS